MGEAKKRREAGERPEPGAHKPPPGMMNVSGRHLTEIARGIMEVLEKPCEEGIEPYVAANAVLATAIDLWRVNYGDDNLREAFLRTIDRRLDKPLSYWGGAPKL